MTTPASRVTAEKSEGMERKLAESADIVRRAVAEFNPTHIVSMVSGGKDSAASDQIARELGLKIDLVVHGNTRCGIPETSQFVRDTYGHLSSDFIEADAGTAYEDYVLRKGFFGKGIGAHGFAYRVLKAQPFRKAISKAIRHGKRGVRILLLNGARQDESENRQKNLQEWRQDPASPGNIWTSLIHSWSQDERDEYLKSRGTPINPVAQQLCRSGECMCGTMQTKGDRAEASVLYPEWGNWLNGLEREVIEKHGFGWGAAFPRERLTGQGDLFQPMCKDCVRRAA
ncbi:phosphoadenosine phosphosulfate reductase [Devosia sp. LC5]|uniref:phosphoadenosine phosphosulfate reductase domain-containing protein n=1 Tax=Devosia sp. LC5 TaxID=1502724 RepID=UPI0004E30163|nr:phosphoadenosine phosphosulfate reductase family protein [Devosia sp. LC5]KFC62732.1 phosphoadenosine phosphosulfate reductase [Devosia sp. LC5]